MFYSCTQLFSFNICDIVRYNLHTSRILWEISLSPSCWARQDTHLSYRFSDLHRINLLTSLTLICEYKGSPSLSALCELLSFSFHTHAHRRLFYEPLLLVFISPVYFPVLPCCFQTTSKPHPRPWITPLYSVISALCFFPVDTLSWDALLWESINLQASATKAISFPSLPLTPAMSVYLFHCLAFFVFPVNARLTGQHQTGVIRRLVLCYHLFDTPFVTEPFPAWLIFVLYVSEQTLCQNLSPQHIVPCF